MRAVKDIKASFPFVVVSSSELAKSSAGNSLPLIELGLSSI